MIIEYFKGSVMCGSRGSESSMSRGLEGADSGSLIFSRIDRSCLVRVAEAIADVAFTELCC